VTAMALVQTDPTAAFEYHRNLQPRGVAGRPFEFAGQADVACFRAGQAGALRWFEGEKRELFGLGSEAELGAR